MVNLVKKLFFLIFVCFLTANFLSTNLLCTNGGASGQFFILTLPNFKTDQEFGQWLEKTKPSGVMLTADHVKNRQKTKELCYFLQNQAKKLGIYPLLITIDWEGGIVSRPTEVGEFTSIPSPYNLAKTGRNSCFLAAQLIGKQMHEVGINIDFAPSLDLFDPKNPVLATRCFSQDPEIITQCGTAFCNGLMSFGITPVIKHYPGLMLGKGDTHFNQVQINASQEEFDYNEKPFLNVLKEKSIVIMVSHAIYKQFGDSPASRSKSVITHLKKHNPDAIVITDDIAMQAYHNNKDLSLAVLESINNGFDLVIYSATPEKQINLIKKINAQISSKKINLSVTKLKQKLKSFKKINFKLNEKEVASNLAQKALDPKIDSLDFSDKKTVLISVDYTKIRPAEILVNAVNTDACLQNSNKPELQTQFASLLKKDLASSPKLNIREFLLDPKSSDQSNKQLDELIESEALDDADNIIIQTFFYGDGIWNKIQTQWLEKLKDYSSKITLLSLGHPSEKFFLPDTQIIELGSFNPPILQAVVNKLTNQLTHKPVLTGANKLAQNPKIYLQNKRFGVLCHKCSVVNIGNKTMQESTQFLPDFLYNWAQTPENNSQLCALFAPEHGILGTTQDGAHVQSEDSSKWGCPVYSLHGATKCPTPEMLKDLDILIIDFQEVGVRCYTYLSTLALTLQAAKDCNVAVLLLERPNPIKFWGAFGQMLNPKFESFLGKVPTQFGHGSTIGQIAKNLNMKIGAELTILSCEPTLESPNSINAYFESNFITPSPNLPTIDSVYAYPMTVFIEGTNYSEGRGTSNPFEQIGAPWIDAEKLAANLNSKKLPGIYFEPVSFMPKVIPGKAENPKHKNLICHGVFLHINNLKKVNPDLTAKTILKELFHGYPKQSKWLKFGNKYTIDLLFGDDFMRKTL